jgi:hypothetical protein
MAQEFSLTSEEKLYKEGSATHFKSMLSGMQGHVYLTSNRLVFCSRGWLFNSALGQIIQLISKPKGIDFEVSLKTLQSITKESHGFASKYTFKASGSEAYTIIFTTGSDKWIEAIVAAKEASSAGFKAKTIGDLIEFVSA